MRRPALIALAVLVASAGVGLAHLRAIGGSLLELLGRSDGVAFVQVLGATEDMPKSYTRLRVVESIAGEVPTGEFLLRHGRQPMRYAKDQRAIVVLARDESRWQAVQVAGEGLVTDGETLDEPTRRYVSSLWRALREPKPPADLADRLRLGLKLPHEKLRLLAAFDLAELAHHPPGLPASTRRALRGDLEDPDLDPAARLVVTRALDDTP